MAGITKVDRQVIKQKVAIFVYQVARTLEDSAHFRFAFLLRQIVVSAIMAHVKNPVTLMHHHLNRLLSHSFDILKLL